MINIEVGGDYEMKTVHMVAYLLLWIGGLNWGLIGLFNFDLVQFLFGGMPAFANFVYLLVGASAVYTMATHMGECKVCSAKK